MKNLFHVSAALLLGLLLASCGRADRMRHLLEQAEWMNQNDSLFTSDSIGKALVRYYDHWWQPSDLRLRAYYMLGSAYRDMGNAPRALENFQLAATQVDTLTAPDSTLNRLMRVHSQMSQIYLLQRMPEQMLEESRIAAHLAWKIGDSQSALIFEHDLCYNLFSNKKYTECVKHALELHHQFSQYGHEDDAKLAYVHCVKSYLALEDYIHAKKFLELYETCSYFNTNPNLINGGIGSLFIYKGQYFQRTNQADSAEKYFRKALPYKKLGSNEILAYKGLYQTYALQNKSDSVLKYIQLYSDAKERSFDEAQTKAIIQTKSLYDYSIEQAEAKAKEKTNARLTIIILVLIFAFAITFYIFLFHREKKKREVSELRREYEIALRELKETENTLAILEEERSADKDLIASFLHDKDKLLTHITYLERELLKRDSRKADINLAGTEIVRKFHNARQHGMAGQYKICDEDWEKLRATVENIYPTFFEVMNARQRLSVKDYRTCLLVKAKFAPSDINILMEQTESYSTQTKKRLHKKVFGFEGTAAEFEQKVNRV